jgi:hypothetical protein
MFSYFFFMDPTQSPYKLGEPCQASLSVNICMRCAPSSDQLLADSLVYSDLLRTSEASGVDDVNQMALKMGQLFPARDGKDVSSAQVVRQCEEMGLRWMSKPIDKNTWSFVQHILPFAQDDGILSAIGEIKRVYPEFDQISKWAKLCNKASMFVRGGFFSDAWLESKATILALNWACDWFYTGFIFVDFEKYLVTNNFLVGARQTDVGTVQVYAHNLEKTNSHGYL